MEPILEIQNVSKKYSINGKGSGFNTLGEALSKAFSGSKRNSTEFFALNNVSFTVNEGDCMGIVGRNGAGKSTLLKIISRITVPTSGRIISRGRIASLLEVGTGFHPELSGKENIFLNGVILGMARKEIISKLDEIIDFSGVEQFIDTPLKHYSSGMQLRLAFAVAAFLEPEILIIDEVLAVGDAEFQKKCIGKMQDVSKSGRTVLFVSHNMAAVQALCNKGVLLSSGSVKVIDTAATVIKEYLITDSSDSSYTRDYTGGLKITRVDSSFANDQVNISLKITSDKSQHISVDVRLKDQLRNPVGFGSLGALNKSELVKIEEGESILQFSFSTHHLANGTYYFSFDLTNPDIEYFDRLDDVVSLEVIGNNKGDLRRLEQAWNLGCYSLNLNSK